METMTSPAKSTRIGELDFLKSVMIILMIGFHLVYFSELHPYAKQVVYTFHMPVFLLISGYLMNFNKPTIHFFKTILWLTVPYLVMEIGYILAASILPIREHIDNLTIGVFINKLLINPIGPYWYLQSVILCGTTYYAIFKLSKAKFLTQYILTAIFFFSYSRFGLVSLPLSLYFLTGIVIRNSTLSFLDVFRPSFLSIIGLAFLIVNPENLHSDAGSGILIVYLSISFFLFIYSHLKGFWLKIMLFLGRNTLVLFLFSPIFTIVCKQFIPILSFDPTGLIFLVVSLIVCITGSLAIGWIMDTCRLSAFFVGREKIIS